MLSEFKGSNDMFEISSYSREVIQQYYKYLSLLRLTHNFQQNPSHYQDLNLNHYQENLTLVGNLEEIDISQLAKGYVYPIMTTTINQNIFAKHHHLRNSFLPIRRKIVIPHETYLKELAIPLNRLIQSFKKKKEQVFAITSLAMYLN